MQLSLDLMQYLATYDVLKLIKEVPASPVVLSMKKGSLSFIEYSRRIPPPVSTSFALLLSWLPKRTWLLRLAKGANITIEVTS